MADMYPVKDVSAGVEADEGGVGYIPNSSAVGAGHEQGLNRQAPFSNSEFPNTESGEGKAPGGTSSVGY